MRRRNSTVVKSRYVRAGSSKTTPTGARGRAGGGSRRSINGALRYIETRPLGAEESLNDRTLFNRDDEGIARRAARDDLAIWVTSGVAYHSLVLSPGPIGNDLNADEMRDWTRHVMADLEARWGVQLTWYAVIHRHTDHIHAHVIVGASHERADGQGIEWTRLRRDDFAAMRESGDHWAEHLRRETALWREVEQYASALLGAALLSQHGGGGGGGPTDRDEIERSLRGRR